MASERTRSLASLDTVWASWFLSATVAKPFSPKRPRFRRWGESGRDGVYSYTGVDGQVSVSLLA